jgi:hypothetical protein
MSKNNVKITGPVDQQKLDMVETKTINDSTKDINEYMGVNILSVVVGAMFFLSASAWIEYARAITEEVYDNIDREKEIMARRSYRKLWSAVTITVISIVLLIICYSWYKRKIVRDEFA